MLIFLIQIKLVYNKPYVIRYINCFHEIFLIPPWIPDLFRLSHCICSVWRQVTINDPFAAQLLVVWEVFGYFHEKMLNCSTGFEKCNIVSVASKIWWIYLRKISWMIATERNILRWNCYEYSRTSQLFHRQDYFALWIIIMSALTMLSSSRRDKNGQR